MLGNKYKNLYGRVFVQTRSSNFPDPKVGEIIINPILQ